MRQGNVPQPTELQHVRNEIDAKLQTNQPLSRVQLSGDDDPLPLLLSQGQESTPNPRG